MRLFVGIPVPGGIATELSSVTAKLPSAFRRSLPEDMHITLEFLGEVSDEQLSCIVTELENVRHRALRVKILGAGSFPGVAFADVEPTPELKAIAADVMERMARCGIAAQSRPYRAHITLARTRQRSARFGRLPIAPREFLADHFVLYRSQLGSSGAHYERLKTFSMASIIVAVPCWIRL